MEHIIKGMQERIKLLKKVIKTAKQEKSDFPEGKLRISYSNHRPRYYHVTEADNSQGEYIKKEDRILVQKLAQKEYKGQRAKSKHTRKNPYVTLC